MLNLLAIYAGTVTVLLGLGAVALISVSIDVRRGLKNWE